MICLLFIVWFGFFGLRCDCGWFGCSDVWFVGLVVVGVCRFGYYPLCGCLCLLLLLLWVCVNVNSVDFRVIGVVY